MRKLLIFISIFSSLFSFNLTPKNFNKILSSHRVVVVEYWASWCIPCSILKPEFEKASKILKKEVFMAKYNVDLGGVKSKNIYTIPTIVIYKNKKEIARTNNIMSAEAIVEWVRLHK